MEIKFEKQYLLTCYRLQDLSGKFTDQVYRKRFVAVFAQEVIQAWAEPLENLFYDQ
jgi:hypothetical protein